MSDQDTLAKIFAFLGVATLILGYVHAHWPGDLNTVGLNGSFLGWTDAEAIPTGDTHYLNVGSLILFSVGIILLIVSPKTSRKILYALLGAFLILMGITIYLWQFPWG